MKLFHSFLRRRLQCRLVIDLLLGAERALLYGRGRIAAFFQKKNWPMHLCGSAGIILVAIGTAESPKSEKLSINVIDVRMSGTNNCENLWVCKER